MPYITKRRISPPNNPKEAAKRHNDKYGKYYQNRQWKHLRDWYILNHPICEDCMFEGRSVPADEVHHIIPYSRGATEQEKMSLLLDPDNLCSLCSFHHALRHKNLNHGQV